MDGYIKLWRKAIDKGWLKNHKLWTFWTYCLLMASGTDGRKLEKYNQVILKRGQFLFGYRKASRDTGLTHQNVRTCIAKLKRWGNINIQSNTQGSIVTVLNYNSYNPLPDKTNTQTNKQLTHGQHTANTRTNTIKESIKESKEDIYMARPKADPRVTEVFKYWTEKYVKLTGEAYLFNYPKEGSLFKRALATYPKDKVLDLIDCFYQQIDDPKCWWADKPTIGTWSSVIPKLIRQLTGG